MSALAGDTVAYDYGSWEREEQGIFYAFSCIWVLLALSWFFLSLSSSAYQDSGGPQLSFSLSQ